jgi:hypothetical protein
LHTSALNKTKNAVKLQLDVYEPLPVMTIDNIEDLESFNKYTPLLTKKIGVYGICNKLNGRKYIGSSAVDLFKRLRSHRGGNKSNAALQCAI